ncbi:HNH endonuclease [Paracoccus litorisediminis]|uniref:HNH endonuclease n=1 Tax=Paracoccus litorisediminis TaxID=2006130 RepID=UPI0037332B99
MIKLQKLDEPEVLARNGERWKQALLEVLGRGEDPTDYLASRYRHQDIKDRLLEETRGKCAYCDGKVAHVAYPHVEHIIPKSRRPDLHFTWANLTLACPVCNVNKGIAFDEQAADARLIDPYNDDPSEHFIFYGDLIIPLPANDRAFITISKLKLSRDELIERRRDRLNYVMALIDLYARSREDMKQLFFDDLMENHVTVFTEFYQTTVSLVKALVANGVISREHAARFPELID